MLITTTRLGYLLIPEIWGYSAKAIGWQRPEEEEKKEEQNVFTYMCIYKYIYI